MSSVQHEPWPCPGCGEILDGSAHAGEGIAYPTPGAATICVYCSMWSIVTEDGLRQANPIEVLLISMEPEAQIAQSIVQRFQKEKYGRTD